MSTMKDEKMLNPWQRIAARTYAHGDFSHMDTKTWAEVRGELDDCGDGLFKFTMIELATSEDCEDAEEALRRLRVAREELEALSEEILSYIKEGL